MAVDEQYSQEDLVQSCPLCADSLMLKLPQTSSQNVNQYLLCEPIVIYHDKYQACFKIFFQLEKVVTNLHSYLVDDTVQLLYEVKPFASRFHTMPVISFCVTK